MTFYFIFPLLPDSEASLCWIYRVIECTLIHEECYYHYSFLPLSSYQHFRLAMSTGARSWLYSTSQMRPPLPPSLSCPLSTISPCLSPMTLSTQPYPSPPPPLPPPPPHWLPQTAQARLQPPLLRTTSTQCCWCFSSSAWCSVMCWCVWRFHGSVLCRPPLTTSLFPWLCQTCCSPRWSCPGASTWRCVSACFCTL